MDAWKHNQKAYDSELRQRDMAQSHQSPMTFAGMESSKLGWPDPKGAAIGATMKPNLMDQVWATTHYAELLCEHIEQIHASLFRRPMNMKSENPEIRETGPWIDETQTRLQNIGNRCSEAMHLLNHIHSDLGLPK